ncbi:MAG: SpoIIE family protein phosphatase [Mariniblastus sp.]|nr:SpoIIE family protein phosphatase [Mariniblastus sp.]
MAILTSVDESVIRQRVHLGRQTIVIGRHPECDIVIDDASVSRHHANISNDNGTFFVMDLESRNGTFVNRSAVHEPTRLFDGAEIAICDIKFKFHLENESVFQPIRAVSFDDSKVAQTVILEDDQNELRAHVTSQLEVPSHYHHQGRDINTEAKLQALIQSARELSESFVLDDVLDRCLSCLFELFLEADRGFIVLKEPSGELRPRGMKMRQTHDERIRISRTIVNQVLETRRPLISSDATTDDRFNLSQSVVDFRLRSIMCAPLISTKNEAIGVIQLDTLRNRVAFSEKDLEVLVTVAMQASLAIQRLNLVQETIHIQELENDLKLAQDVQQAFLPQRRPDFPEFEFFSFYSATMAVGGDYYDYIPIGDDKIAIVVADVVGHGVAAALLMAKVAAESRFALASSGCPIKAMGQINQSLSELNLDKFVTLLLVMIDRKDHHVQIVNAGHMPPLIRKDSGAVMLLDDHVSGLPLGLGLNETYHSLDFTLMPGDVLVLYTDGINESMDKQGNQLGIHRLIDEIQASQTKRPETIGKFICQLVNRHVDGQQPADDMCLVCVGLQSSSTV